MAEKFTVYFGQPLANATAGYEDQRSARINRIAHEWLALVADNVPQLTANEWQAMMASTTSAAIADDNTLRLLWASVADAAAECQQFAVDAEALSAKLRKLTLAQRYALRETLERFWVCLDEGQDIQQALQAIGVDQKGLPRWSEAKRSGHVAEERRIEDGPETR